MYSHYHSGIKVSNQNSLAYIDDTLYPIIAIIILILILILILIIIIIIIIILKVIIFLKHLS